jgi:hypothetical protein
VRDHLAAARAAQATRASILSTENWPVERRTIKAAPELPSGINIPMTTDCIRSSKVLRANSTRRRKQSACQDVYIN